MTIAELLVKLDEIMALGGYLKCRPSDDEDSRGEWAQGHLPAAHGAFLAAGWKVTDANTDMVGPPPDKVASFPGMEGLEVFLWPDGAAWAHITDLGVVLDGPDMSKILAEGSNLTVAQFDENDCTRVLLTGGDGSSYWATFG